MPVTLVADAGGWYLGVGCPGEGTSGSSTFTACRTASCTGEGFLSRGSCSRTATRFTKFTFETWLGGNLRSPTTYALHTGDVLITPAILNTEQAPIFTAQTTCPVADATLNWIFVQWDSGTRTMSNTYVLGTATYSMASGVALTKQYDINGTNVWSGNSALSGTCANGQYTVTGQANPELNGTGYYTANGGGVYKASSGHAVFFLPQYTTTLATDLGSKTARGISFDSRLASNTHPSVITTNAAGTQFAIYPYLDAEAGTIDSSFTDVISITAVNSPLPGMLRGTISRNGGTATNVACILNKDPSMRVICSGQSPADPQYPFTVAFTVDADATLVCPTGYARVPADTSVGVSAGFCLAKYEMKIQGQASGNQVYSAAFVAESRASGTPWGRIDRDQAIAECQALGKGYDLVTNAQWQAAARNIEDAYSAGAYLNWSYGRQDNTPSQNVINVGHSDNAPNAALEASSDDADGCYGTLNTNCKDNTHLDFRQKRTHTLSNGDVLWDMGANIQEFVKDNNTDSYNPNDVTAAENFGTGGGKTKWGPRGSYTAAGTYPKTTTPFGGLGYAYLNSMAGSIVRSGMYYDGTNAGVFSAWLYIVPTTTNANRGFRCAYTP